MPYTRSLRRARWPGALLALAVLVACGDTGGGGGGAGQADTAAAAADTSAGADSTASVAFRNSVTGVDSGWTGPVFALSHAYPDTFDACTPATCPWLSVQVDTGSASWASWSTYLETALAYLVQGQTPTLNDSTGWQTTVNGATRWFHVPWMAYDDEHGREFIHGTTNERTAGISAFDLRSGLRAGPAAAAAAARHTPTVLVGRNSLPGVRGTTNADTLFETWSVGMYNVPGGYTVGKAVPGSGVPQAGGPGNLALPVRFPLGTMVVKLLFTSATARSVPYLINSPQWTVDRHVQLPNGQFDSVQRAPAPVHLVQMDVAVRDDRSPIGWVYGTYAYDGRRPGAAWWQRMAPVGVQWGSDPLTWPAVDSAQSRPLTQSAIAGARNQHLGCAGRLAGPVDNPKSSCTSCHGGAYVPSPVGTVSTSSNSVPIFGYATQCATVSPQNSAYFSNVAYPAQYPAWPGVSGQQINLDTSLQLQVAYKQYANFLSTAGPAAQP
ncbi:MAG TPA: hypothetical protein VEX86_09420 [Longimicrobium sp.]|nr:hypothetical protein [Longimicrobium sp.]